MCSPSYKSYNFQAWLRDHIDFSPMKHKIEEIMSSQIWYEASATPSIIKIAQSLLITLEMEGTAYEVALQRPRQQSHSLVLQSRCASQLPTATSIQRFKNSQAHNGSSLSFAGTLILQLVCLMVYCDQLRTNDE